MPGPITSVAKAKGIAKAATALAEEIEMVGEMLGDNDHHEASRLMGEALAMLRADVVLTINAAVGALPEEAITRNKREKLTRDRVLQIRVMRASYKYSIPGIAKQFGISRQQVHNIVSGRTWTNVGGPIMPKAISTLDDRKVVRIREMFAQGRLSTREIADLFGIKRQCAVRVITGKRWPKAGGPIVKIIPYNRRKRGHSRKE